MVKRKQSLTEKDFKCFSLYRITTKKTVVASHFIGFEITDTYIENLGKLFERLDG